MTQFDVRRNPSPRTRNHTPYVLVIQCDLLADLEPVAVVPLRRVTPAFKVIARLNPRFTVDGVEVVMLPNAVAGVTRRDLGEVVANLSAHRYDIVGAMDMLLSGI